MVRDAVQKDKQAFISMAAEFYSSGVVMHDINPVNFETTFNAAMDKSPYVRILMIESDEKPIGYALLSQTYSNEAGGMVLLIEEVYINEAYRGGGHGKGLFEFLEEQYPAAKRFRLEVMGDNQKAISLYKRIGFDVLNYVQMVKDF